ncbi:hypothetical protein N7493_004269 [Penicillium malachiteum]|uniref:Zn(2)-C6 fungal-type domain-containing protein n=1 Tax=Penicillium malachiteum TaxID=1324776 RepID=A0AAD6HSB0_9EURO|nr:hypothetical protein N7493_004269 [Penicillium malachiteum]
MVFHHPVSPGDITNRSSEMRSGAMSPMSPLGFNGYPDSMLSENGSSPHFQYHRPGPTTYSAPFYPDQFLLAPVYQHHLRHLNFGPSVMDRPHATSMHYSVLQRFSNGYDDQYTHETEAFSGNMPGTMMDQSTLQRISDLQYFHRSTSPTSDCEESSMCDGANEPLIHAPVARASTEGSQSKIMEWTEPMIPNQSFNPPSPTRSASPIEYSFVMEDPRNPQRCVRRARSRSELDKQKEDIRQLKDNGGACTRCYKSKKKCSTSTPCNPCVASRTKCIRRETRSSPPRNKRSRTSDVEVSSSLSPDPDTTVVNHDMPEDTPWEVAETIDGTDCGPDAVYDSADI